MTKSVATRLALLIALFALALVSIVLPAQAARLRYERAINMADMQRMLTQKMSKESALIALGVDKDQNLRNLQSTRDLFDRTLDGLREGDAELGLPQTTDPETLEKLEKVEEIWHLFNAAVRQSIEAGEVSAIRMETIADLSLPMLNAIDKAVETYESAAAQSGLFSILGIAIGISGRQRMLSQRMTKEFLLVVHGHEVERNRKNLKETITSFDQTLQGLIDGNLELRLLPAPTPEIEAQLRKVGRIWKEIQPLLKSVADGASPDRAAIAKVARLNMPLLKAINMTVFMYEAF